MRYFLLIAILLFGVTGFAQDKTANIKTGRTYNNMGFTAADTINESQTYYIEVTNYQNYPAMQDVWIELDSVTGAMGAVVTVYGKKFSDDSYTSIGSAVTLAGFGTDTTFNYPITTANRYRYWKIEIVTDATDQQMLVSNVEFKNWFTGGEFSTTSLNLSGTLTVAGESTFNNHINLGAGDDLLGSTTSDINIGSGNFTVAGANGNTLVGGTLTSTGLITANNGVTLGAGDDLIGSSTSDITINTTAFTVAGATGDVGIGNDLSVTNDILLLDGAVVGITGNEVITFNASGSINFTGATVDIDGAFTASSVVSDAAVSGTAITGSTEANFTNNAAAVTFGAVGTDADVVLAFDAVTAQGSITYMEDEDRFDFDNDVDILADLTVGTIISDAAITATSGVDLGTSQALVGTTAMTIGDGTQTVNINSSDWNIDATGVMTGIGAITSDGVITATGGITFATVSTHIWSVGGSIIAVTDGNDAACSDGDRYWSEIMIPYNVTITGASYLVGSVGGTDSVVMQMFNSAGVEVATSKTTGVNHGAIVATTAEFQNCDFVIPYAAVAGIYYIGVQFNGTTAKFRTYTIPNSKFVAGTAGGTWDTKADITPGTSFTANKGPIILTY